MKDVFKCVGLLMVGLFVAVIVYPFLHEVGHSVVAILVGGKVIDFNILPLPYVVCDLSRTEKAATVFIGLAGIFFPAILSKIINPKSFWLWYGNIVMRGICLLSFIISFVAIIFNSFNIKVENEDIVQVINVWKGGTFILAILMLFAIIIIIHSIIKQKPIDKILIYFKIDTKKASAA